MISKKKKVLVNTGWMTAQQIVGLMISLIVGPISARYLQPENYGLLGYGSAIISIFSAVSLLGINSVLVQELVANPQKNSSLLGAAYLLRFAASVVCYACSVLCIVIMEPGSTLLLAIVALQSLTIIFQTYDVFEAWFQMKLEMKYVSIAMIIVKIFTITWQLSLLIFRAPVVLFAATGSISTLLCGTIIFLFFKKRGIRIGFSFEDAKYILSKSHHFIISGLAIVIYMQIDKVMIAKMIDSANVGIYNVAVSLSTIWQFVPMAILNSARPLVLERKEQDNDQYYKYLKMTMAVVSAFCLTVCIGFTVLARPIIYILYGEAYIGATVSLRILVWATMVAMIGCVRSVWILGDGLSKYDKYFTVTAAVINVVLNFILIDCWGIVGAAASTLISQFYEVFIAPFLFKKTRGFASIYVSSWKELPNAVRLFRR